MGSEKTVRYRINFIWNFGILILFELIIKWVNKDIINSLTHRSTKRKKGRQEQNEKGRSARRRIDWVRDHKEP